jgi:hypothetical protein
MVGRLKTELPEYGTTQFGREVQAFREIFCIHLQHRMMMMMMMMEAEVSSTLLLPIFPTIIMAACIHIHENADPITKIYQMMSKLLCYCM